MEEVFTFLQRKREGEVSQWSGIIGLMLFWEDRELLLYLLDGIYRAFCWTTGQWVHSSINKVGEKEVEEDEVVC